MKPLYAITTVFNPRRFRSRFNLANRFTEWVRKSGVQLLTVEVSFGEREHVLTQQSDPWHIQLVTRHEMWHKERALNIGLNRLSTLAPDWGYVAWMDADIKLARDDWAEEAVHLLQHYAVIQMFGEARWLDPNYHTLFSSPSIAKNFHEDGHMEWGHNPGDHSNFYAKAGHPGLAWAFRRDELNDTGGWLDICINGSADLHMAVAYAGQAALGLSPKASPGYRRAILQFGELCDSRVRRNMSYMAGACDHYWHGRSKERGYLHRWKLVDKYKFDPYTDLVQDIQGLYRWRMDDPRVRSLAVATRHSLAKRNEDVNEI